MDKEIRIRDIVIIFLALAAFAFVGFFQLIPESKLVLIIFATLIVMASIASGVKSIIKIRQWTWRTKLCIALYIVQFALYVYTMVKGDDYLFYLMTASIPFACLMETIVLPQKNS